MKKRTLDIVPDAIAKTILYAQSYSCLPEVIQVCDNLFEYLELKLSKRKDISRAKDLIMDEVHIKHVNGDENNLN